MSVKPRGRFLVLEGVEGVGKSTQVKALEAWCAQQNIKCVTTREPGGTPLAEEIRSLVLTPREEPMCPETELLLMMAARLQHWHQKIQPLLEQGTWVICDRFIDSSVAYQGAGRGLAPSLIRELHNQLAPTMKPDLVVLLDMSVEASFIRVAERGEATDRMEQASQAFFHRARECFLDSAAQDPNRYAIVDARQDIASITTAIIQACQQKLSVSFESD